MPAKKSTGAAAEVAEKARLDKLLHEQREAFHNTGAPSYEERMEHLDTLLSVTRERTDDLAAAMSADFGNRSMHETLTSEVFTTVSLVKYVQKHLKEWMQPEKRRVSPVFWPGRAHVRYQPLGVVGILSPWNYPYYLAAAPLLYALAAGNRAMVKPSEITPKTADVIRDMMARTFPEDRVAVVTGGAGIGAAFSSLPFDHLFFTGSTSVGKSVMKAAAENLTPVTLELGGKSPAIVAPGYSPRKAAERITAGKFFNAGQTCVAPDYVLAQKDDVDELVVELRNHIERFYPTLADNPDYTAIVSDRHFARLLGVVDDARAKGATLVEIKPAGEELLPGHRKMAPTLLLDITDEMVAATDEIFGPILPIVAYDGIDDAIRYVNRRPRPLALYCFDEDESRIDRVLEHTISGGVCVNDAVLQVAQDDLPFGGVGQSGMGAYHGPEGFYAFSHARGVFSQGRINTQFLLRPPYNATQEKALRYLINK